MSKRLVRRLLVPAAAFGLAAQLVVAPPPTIAVTGRVRHGAVEHRARVLVRDVKATTPGRARPAQLGAALPLGHSVTHPAGGVEPRVIGRAAGLQATPLVPAAAPANVTEFGGVRRSDTVGVEPPDPWIAVSPTHVVQSTNDRIRITNRAGALVQALPVRSLFALFPYEIDTDPRIVWDAAHARWVGVVLSFPSDYSANYLNLAVSETADPTGAWDIYSYLYTDDSLNPTLPDYPGIASSGDKIILTANEFDRSLTNYLGASVLVLRWSDILAVASPSPIIWTVPDPSVFTIRPAQVLSPSNDLHLIAMDATDLSVLYRKISGTAFAGGWTDLHGTVADFTDPALLPAPRQADQPGVTTKWVDSRPTDAVWRNGHLWLVATHSFSFDAGAHVNDAVRVTELSTAATPVFAYQDSVLGADGEDFFMPGIGVSGDGTAFMVYSRSSSTNHPRIEAVADPASADTWSSPVVIEESDAGYGGQRWGDYVGVAADPSGTAAVWQANEVAADDQTWRTVVSRLLLDRVNPTVTTPVQTLLAGTTLGRQAVAVRTAWTGADAGSGVASYRVRVDQFGTGFQPATYTPATSITRAEAWKPYPSTANASYRYEVTAIDAAGNESASPVSAALHPTVYQQTPRVAYTGTWTTSKSSSYSGGSARSSTSVGSTATFSSTLARSIGFVTYRASNRGKVRIYLDNVYKGTFRITSSTTRARYILYVANFSSAGTHKIKLVVASGRVDVDAFVVLRSV